ncbi:MAG: hypothetical protein U0822_03205 [Anaerolineae bacterium]
MGHLGHQPNSGQQRVGAGLQDRAAALLHRIRLVRQAHQEGIHLLAHLGRRLEARVGRHGLPHPVSDRLVGVEVGAVARQRRQEQLEVGIVRYVRKASP